jgi:hypothetical protein
MYCGEIRMAACMLIESGCGHADSNALQVPDTEISWSILLHSFCWRSLSKVRSRRLQANDTITPQQSIVCNFRCPCMITCGQILASACSDVGEFLALRDAAACHRDTDATDICAYWSYRTARAAAALPAAGRCLLGCDLQRKVRCNCSSCNIGRTDWIECINKRCFRL